MAVFKRSKYSKSKSTEKQELGILEKLLNEADLLTKITGGDDDFPAIDGYLHLLNAKRELTGQTLHVQIKPIKYKSGGIPFSICKSELLAYAYESSTPVLLIGVDGNKEIAYWKYLAPELAAVFFQEQNNKKSTSISFAPQDVIKKNGPNYVKEWHRICSHHRNQSNDKIVSRFVRKRKEESIEKQISLVSLETLNDFMFYRTNSGEYPFFDYVLLLSPEILKRDESSKLRYIEILEQIYYYRTVEVLKILFTLALDEIEIVAEKAKKILLDISKYNFHILNSLGYLPHRLLVNEIDNFVAHGGKDVRKIAREILKNVLNNSYEGTSNPDNITITFHQGALDPIQYLQKIRSDAIKSLFSLFKFANTTEERAEILSAIFHGFHAPDQATEESYKRYLTMVNNEAADAIKQYKKIVFTSKGTLSEEYPIVYEIEHQMVWLTTWKRNVVGLAPFLNELRTIDSDYSFYRVIFGEAQDISPDEDYETGKQKKESNIKKYLDSITSKNLVKWYTRLAHIAAFANALKDSSDAWKFNYFRDFLARIGRYKPKLADQMLCLVFDRKDSLYPLAGNILFGLRRSSLSLWDKYVKLITDDASQELTKAILISFEFHPRPDVGKKIRTKDVKLLTRIIRKENEFSYIKEDEQFLYHAMRAVLYAYNASPKQCRILIVELLKSHPKEIPLFFGEMSFALWQNANWLTLENWSKTELNVIAGALIDVERIDHDEERMLLYLGKVDFDVMISVIVGRLKKASMQNIDFSVDPPFYSRYDALPYHFSNQELGEFIRSHPKYKNILLSWIRGINNEYAAECVELSALIRFINGPILRALISELIVSGKKVDIKKILTLFPRTEPPDFDLCFQIIEATDDEEIIRSIRTKMLNLGGLGGTYEDDLYGNGLRRVKEQLEREGLSHKSQRVKDFSSLMIKNLERDIEISAQQNKERLQREKREFEESQF